MNFHIITIFPEMFDSYFNESILGRAQKENKININIYNLRDYADPRDKRRTIDDTPYGGGPGMVMMVEPIFKCVENIKAKIKNKSGLLILLTSAKGKLYDQQKAEKIKQKYTDVIIICGRYEGVDERVAKFIADEEVSIGRYVLTGGELPAMIIVDSITRLLEGVLGNKESLLSESYQLIKEGEKCGQEMYDYPVYTKPAEFNNWKVPEVLQSGNHREIAKWRQEKSKKGGKGE
jgi:tRNA (guanine37-N1)-methyltransferase